MELITLGLMAWLAGVAVYDTFFKPDKKKNGQKVVKGKHIKGKTIYADGSTRYEDCEIEDSTIIIP